MEEMSRLQVLMESLKDDPSDTFTKYLIAVEHKGQEDYQEALVWLNKIHEDDPNYVPAYFMAAQCYEALEEFSAAISQYKEGITVAKKVGDLHAAREMQGALDLIEDEV